MLAATAALFAACAETDLVNEVNVVAEPQAIGFETFANKATRTDEGTSNTALEFHHESFNVWASKQLGVEGNVSYSPVYNPGTVSINTGGEWIASPLRFWDKAALNYYFYAAAPTSATWAYNNTDGDDSEGYLTLANYKLVGTNLATGTASGLVGTWKNKTAADDDKDLMVATKVSRANATFNNNSLNEIQKVDFTFRHILSKLNIKVKGIDLSDYNATITLNSLDVCNLKCKGSFNDNETEKWNLEEDVDNLQMTDGESDLTLTESYVYTHEYLVMPQEVEELEGVMNVGIQPESGVYLYIQYTITTNENGVESSEVFKTYYGLANIFGAETLEFNEGRQNTLAVTISPDVIEFEVETDELGWDNTEEVPVESPKL